MNECRDLEPVLAAYVDGEATAADCERVRQHTEACGTCREQIASQRLAREVVRARREGLRAPAPATLKAQCAAHAVRSSLAVAPGLVSGAAGPAAPARPASFVRRWAPLSLAATVVLAVATVFGLGLNDKVQALAFQTTVDHVTCSRFKAVSADLDPGAAAEQWNTRFGWAISVPASSPAADLELQAVRRCLVTDGSVAHMIYSWMGESLSVFVLPKRTLGDVTRFARRFRHNTVMWSRNDRTYIVVTPRPRDPSLDKVVAYVQAHAY